MEISSRATARRSPRPDWLKVRLPNSAGYFRLRALVAAERINTVCEDARCPNIGECWGAGTATLMILGETCTRACGFCAVRTGRPAGLGIGETPPAAAVARLLRHCDRQSNPLRPRDL